MPLLEECADPQRSTPTSPSDLTTTRRFEEQLHWGPAPEFPRHQKPTAKVELLSERVSSADSVEAGLKSPALFLADLEAILDAREFDDVASLIDEVDPGAFSPGQIGRTLKALRDKRLFYDLEKTAGLFVMTGHDLPLIRRQWAQALLDQGRVTQALGALEGIRESVADDPDEGPEIRGLIGRAYKQRYIEGGGSDDLRRAIAAYEADWLADSKNRWHGINLVALVERARRDGVDVGGDHDPRAVARRILDDLKEVEELYPWDMATALEASIALGDETEALAWGRRYVKLQSADAFELGSTLRQLREIWRVESSPLGKRLVPLIEGELLKREGGSTRLSELTPQREEFEAVYGPEGYVRFQWLETLHRLCRGVGRIFDTNTGEPFGTGFVVRGGDLFGEWGDRPVLVTNSHVLSDHPQDHAPLRSGQASVMFTRLPDSPSAPLGAILFSSPRVDLDVTICRLEPPPGAEPLELTRHSPAMPVEGRPRRIFVIGHPRGGELVVSLYDNDLSGFEGRYVRYRSPTEPGHSGSPVLDQQWVTFAIHHRTLHDLRVNEGVLLEHILAGLLGA